MTTSESYMAFGAYGTFGYMRARVEVFGNVVLHAPKIYKTLPSRMGLLFVRYIVLPFAVVFFLEVVVVVVAVVVFIVSAKLP